MAAVHLYWTDKDDARLRELVDENLSYAEIGALMGRNKNQCIGRAHRLGIQREVRATHKKTIAKAVAKAVDKLFSPKPAPAQDNNPQPRFEQPEASTTAFGVPRTLMGLQAYHCRWPVSGERADTLFCCAKRESLTSPYCENHRLIAWRPTTRQLTEKAYR